MKTVMNKKNENPIDKMLYYFNMACHNERNGKLTGLMEIYMDYMITAENPLEYFQTPEIKAILEKIQSSNQNNRFIEFREDDVYVNLSLVKVYLLHADSYTFELLSVRLEIMSDLSIHILVSDKQFEKFNQNISRYAKLYKEMVNSVLESVPLLNHEMQSFLLDIIDNNDLRVEDLKSIAKSLLEVSWEILKAKNLDLNLHDELLSFYDGLEQEVETDNDNDSSSKTTKSVIEELKKSINSN